MKLGDDIQISSERFKRTYTGVLVGFIEKGTTPTLEEVTKYYKLNKEDRLYKSILNGKALTDRLIIEYKYNKYAIIPISKYWIIKN